MTSVKTHASGFTILELVIVISILGTLAAFAIPSFIHINQEAKVNKAMTDINTLGSAVVQKFHELAGLSSEWPTLANAKSMSAITNSTVLFYEKTNYSTIYWADLFQSKTVPLCPIDKQPYLMNVINTGSVNYISAPGGSVMANIVDPEFKILWISQSAPPDTLSAVFRP